MKQPIYTSLLTLCNRQRLPLVLGSVLVLLVVLFNHFVTSVDSNGWSSGFTHPLHGGDHFLTMLAVGIWAAQLRGKAIWLLPLTFVGVMSLGGIAGAAGLFIPSAELIILLSGLVFSVFIVRRMRFSSQINVIIVAFFAFFHGFAHGQEISTSASLISYTLGFMVATLLLHGAGILVVRLLVMIFALLLSQLAYAHASVSHVVTQASTQITQFKQHTDFSMLSDCIHDDMQQIEDDDGGGGLKPSEFSQNQWMRYASTNNGREFIRAVHQICHAVAYTVVSHWLLSPQIGIHFLTNGVGDTAPPVIWISHVSLPVIAPHDDTLVLKTAPHFDISLVLQTLATCFLTNGVGATSPPVGLFLAVVVSFVIYLLAVCYFSSIALSRILVFSLILISNARCQSRAPPRTLFFASNAIHNSHNI